MSSPDSTDQLTVVNLFAGAGGLSTGVAKACEDLDLTPSADLELHAINHWEPAIETHERNHPWAEHYHAKIEELYPPDVVESGTLDLLTGGPSCNIRMGRTATHGGTNRERRARAVLLPDVRLAPRVPRHHLPAAPRHDFEANGRGKQRSLQRSAMGFGCRSCGRRIPHLYDRKEHTLATPLDP